MTVNIHQNLTFGTVALNTQIRLQRAERKSVIGAFLVLPLELRCIAVLMGGGGGGGGGGERKKEGEKEGERKRGGRAWSGSSSNTTPFPSPPTPAGRGTALVTPFPGTHPRSDGTPSSPS